MTRCAIPTCPNTIALPSSTEVYGESDPFPTPTMIASGTGWKCRRFHYFCPDHLDGPERYGIAVKAWEAERDRVTREWVRANPVPGNGWL